MRFSTGVLGALVAGSVLAPPGPARATHEHVTEVRSERLSVDSTLSLPALEAWVLARNPDLEAARHALEAASRRPSFEGALESPELGLAIGPSALGDPRYGTAYRVSIEQMIPLGKLGPQADAARAEAAAERANLAAVSGELLRQTRQAYVEYVRASAVKEVLDELRDLTERFRKAALSRYASGLVSEADPLMAEVELSHLDHQAITSERERQVARARLNVLLHREWNSSLPPARPVFDSPVDPPPLDSLVARARLARPEIAAAQAQAKASEARLRFASRQNIPDIGLMAAYDRFWQEKPLRPMVGVSLRLPVWRGRIAAQAGEARARVSQARALAAAAGDQVGFEVQDAYLRVTESAHEAHLIQGTEIPAIRRALSAARAGYESGKNDFSALVNAERSLAEARMMELRVLAEHHAALADLERAIGTPAPVSAVEESPVPRTLGNLPTREGSR